MDLLVLCDRLRGMTMHCNWGPLVFTGVYIFRELKKSVGCGGELTHFKLWIVYALPCCMIDSMVSVN